MKSLCRNRLILHALASGWSTHELLENMPDCTSQEIQFALRGVIMQTAIKPKQDSLSEDEEAAHARYVHQAARGESMHAMATINSWTREADVE
jgi:hypothetical protein